MSVMIEVVEDLAHACAAMMVGAASGGGDIVLSGGSTPKAAYEDFVETVRSVGVDLSETTFWVGDERCVAPDDDRSNLKMIRETLLDPLGPGPTMHAMQGALGPDAGADDYERQIVDEGDPRFTLMLLGIGPDGHTLSLFPDQPTLEEQVRLVVGVPEAGHEPFVSRISMSWVAVELADHAVLLASGEDKAQAIASAFGPDARPDRHVPCSMLPAHARKLTVLLDAAAASRLPDSETRT